MCGWELWAIAAFTSAWELAVLYFGALRTRRVLLEAADRGAFDEHALRMGKRLAQRTAGAALLRGAEAVAARLREGRT